MSGLPTLTLWQPWASLVAAGVKTVETRSWSTKHRGRIGIHAAARLPGPNRARTVACRVGRWACWSTPNGWTLQPEPECSGGVFPLPFGALVATAELVDVVPTNTIEWCDEPSHDRDRDWVMVEPGELASVRYAQRPYGDFTPGRYAWLLDDIKPTTERCPACWGDGGFIEDSILLYGMDWADPCPVCNPDGAGTLPLGAGVYGCDPIPAKGHQRLWRWEPISQPPTERK